MTLPSPPPSGAARAPSSAAHAANRAAALAAGPQGFAWPVRVYYEDTDAGGVVYYANYLRYFERCRTEWMRAIGFGQHEMAERDGVVFVVASAEIKYLRPARLDDALRVNARIAERFGSYVVFEQEVYRDDQVLCRSRMKVACVDSRSLRPTRLPAALAAALEPAGPEASPLPDAAIRANESPAPR